MHRKVNIMPKQAQARTEKKSLTDAQPRKTIKRSASKGTAAEDKHDARDARLALKEAGPKGSIKWEQLKREVGI
jgi:hypothetical protein